MDVFSQLSQLLTVGGIREGKYLNICPVTSDNENQTWKKDSRRASSSYFTLTDKGTVSADWKARTTGTGYFFHSVNDWPQQLFGMMSLGLWGLTDVTRVCRSPSHHGRGKLRTMSRSTSSLRNGNVLCTPLLSYGSGWLPVHTPSSQNWLLLV